MKPRKVLVADDDRGTLTMMQAALESTGFAVTLVSNGNDAIAAFQHETFDMVFLDVDMPVCNGLTVCKHIRRAVGVLLPIVMVTGTDDVTAVEAAYQAGATDFISKPVNWALIAHRAHYLLRNYQNQLALRAANGRVSAMLRALPDQLLELDADGRCLQYHRPTHSCTAALDSDPTGRHLRDVLGDESAAVCVEATREAITRGVSNGKQFQILVNGEPRWLYVTASRYEIGDRLAATALVIIHDITEQYEAAERIRKLAYEDSLTGLPNRACFKNMVADAIDTATREHSSFAVLSIDFDKFKRINDTLGHTAGDELLRIAASNISVALTQSRPTCDNLTSRSRNLSVARLGGDEFMILVPEPRDEEEAQELATRVIQSVSTPLQVAGHQVLVTPSVGIALFPEHGQTHEALAKNADLAMYFAKRIGPGSSAIFTPSMNTAALKRLTLENHLRNAIDNHEFSLAYQPQIDIRTSKICGVEALLRWNNPELGPVPPSEFISVAEETGLILSIGEWVLRTASKQARSWVQEGIPTCVSVNVSTLQLLHPGFVDLVASVLQEENLSPSMIELEITESVFMDHLDTAAEILTRIKAIGVSIAIDDFGSGHSSLNRLRTLPLDRLKIDRLFISNIQRSEEDRAIAAAIISMAKALQVNVVAEGVEDPAQLLELQDAHCDVAQGYLFGRPMKSEDISRILTLSTQDNHDSRTQRLKMLVNAVG